MADEAQNQSGKESQCLEEEILCKIRKEKTKQGRLIGMQVLREDGLSYYEKESDENRMGIIAFSTVQVNGVRFCILRK